jgi:hypothetical protein
LRIARSKLNLDELFPSPPSLLWAPRTTLLNYASFHRKDAICGALLRARADPSIRWAAGMTDGGGGGGGVSENALEALRELLPRAAVWTVNKVLF